MLPHTAFTNSHENFRTLLRLRAQDVFVESETHSIIDCLQCPHKGKDECTTEAGVESSPGAISSISVNSITGLELLLKASN